MKKIIGFAEKFYTLWSHEREIRYVTDSYGNNHPSHILDKYHYIKNISIDINKVKEMYPGVEIDECLRGQVRSFERMIKIDPPNNIFWFGKYRGRLVDEIMVSDFGYCKWAVGNGGNIAEYIETHPQYVAYLEKLENEKQAIIDNTGILKVGDTIQLDFTSNGYNPSATYDSCHASSTYGDINVYVECNGVKEVNGMYPYLMPVINGKAQRTKNKKVTVTVLEVILTDVRQGGVSQWIKIS